MIPLMRKSIAIMMNVRDQKEEGAITRNIRGRHPVVVNTRSRRNFPEKLREIFFLPLPLGITPLVAGGLIPEQHFGMQGTFSHFVMCVCALRTAGVEYINRVSVKLHSGQTFSRADSVSQS